MKYKQYLSTTPSLHKIIHGKLQHKEGNYSLEKAIRKFPCNKPKEERHTNIILPLAIKITGNSNHNFLVSLNINVLNSPIKTHILTDCIYSECTVFCCMQETHLSDKNK